MMKNLKTLALIGFAAGMLLPTAVQAEEMNEQDAKVWRESVEERLRGLHNEAAEANNIHLEAFSDIRSDYVDTPGSNSGSFGLYNRRAEAKFHGKVHPQVTAALGFDFTELKLKDCGIQIDALPLLVFMGPEVSIRLGQYRMPFGIETQTSSSAIYFAERSFLNGGAGGTKLIGERALGLQGSSTLLKSDSISLHTAFGAFNNLSQDQTSGVNKLQDGTAAADANAAQKNPDNFDKQVLDQDLSYIGRVGLELGFLKNLLPEKSKLVLGASYGRDSDNSAWRAQSAAVRYGQVVGADVAFALGKQIKLQSEWVGTQTHTVNASNVVSMTQREAWYAQTAFDILPFFSDDIAKGDAIELLARIEQEMSFNTTAGPKFGQAIEKNRIAGGVKYSYWGGKSHTALNYYVTGNNGQFGSTASTTGVTGTGGPATMVVVQQQFAFENGKPKWMEKIAE